MLLLQFSDPYADNWARNNTIKYRCNKYTPRTDYRASGGRGRLSLPCHHTMHLCVHLLCASEDQKE